MIRFGTFAALAAALFATGCGDESSSVEAEEVAGREQRFASRFALATGDSAAAPLARWVLPPQLLEVSGLALTPTGNLLAHNDEQAIVYVIDPRRGVILKQFTVGKKPIRGDFEGIATSGAEIFLLASDGTIYRFAEGEDEDRVPHTRIDTKLGRECEFEGIAVDSAGLILLACKNVGKKGPRDQMVIYRYDPRTARTSLLTVPYSVVIGGNPWKNLQPSDITIDPATSNYVVIAAQQQALIVVTPDGEVIRSGPLPERSRQAEGVAISRDGILYVSDEGSTSPATISLYRWPLPPLAQSHEAPPIAEQGSQ